MVRRRTIMNAPDERQIKAAMLEMMVERGLALFPLWHIKPKGGCSCGRWSCTRPGKHPHRACPNGLKDATHDLDRILAFHEKVPEANWGVATGEASGIDCIDIDVRDNGTQNFFSLCADLGIGPIETWGVETGSHGVHVYVAHAPGVTNARRGLPPGIDIRGDGGYVVAPPSNHVANPTFNSYRWVIWPDDVPLAPWPQPLLDLVLASKTVPLNVCPVPPQVLRERAWDVPPGLLAFAKTGRHEGDRDNGAYWLACKLREEVADDALAQAVLADFAAHCTPPLGERDVARIWRSACQHTSFGPRPVRASYPPIEVNKL